MIQTNKRIVQWPNTALNESKPRKYEGQNKQIDFVDSIIQHSTLLLYVGEVSSPPQRTRTVSAWRFQGR